MVQNDNWLFICEFKICCSKSWSRAYLLRITRKTCKSVQLTKLMQELIIDVCWLKTFWNSTIILKQKYLFIQKNLWYSETVISNFYVPWRFLNEVKFCKCFKALDQRFPTGVPRHTRMPQRGVWGAAKCWITAFFIDVFLYRVPPFFLNIWGMPWSKKRWKTLI
jgi:hypothetical protein